MPLIGFYLQTAVGGIALSRGFWSRFASIDNVVAIKVAPFNRYRTLDVASPSSVNLTLNDPEYPRIANVCGFPQ